MGISLSLIQGRVSTKEGPVVSGSGLLVLGSYGWVRLGQIGSVESG